MEINKTMEQNQVQDNANSQINNENIQREEERQSNLRRQAKDEAANRSYWSDTLLENKKSFGDSLLMKRVKTDLALVEKSKTELGVQNYTDDEFLVLMGKYFSAIESCRQYLNERSAAAGKGAERRMMVQKNLNHLIREVELLGQTKELLRAGVLIGEDEADMEFTLQELLLRTRVCELGSVNGVEYASEKEITQEVTDPGLKKVLSLFEPMNRKIKNKKEAQAYGRDIGELRKCLKEIPEGESYTSFASLSDQQILISQDANGVVTISTKDASAVLKEGVFDLMRIVDSNMIEGSDMMRKEDLVDMIRDQKDYDLFVEEGNWSAHRNAGDIQKSGSRLARFLEIKTGKPSTFFSNIESPILKMLAELLIQGTKPSEVIKAIEENEKAHQLEGKRINTSETLDLVRQTIGKEAYVNEKIVFHQQQNRNEQQQDGWEDDERKTRDLIADMVFSQDTWENDETTAKPGERMRRMLLSHKDALATLIADNYRKDQNAPSILERMLDKLPLNMAGVDGNDLKSVLRKKVERLNSIVEKAIMAAYAIEQTIGDEDDAYEHFVEAQTMKRDKNQLAELIDRVLKPENMIENALLFNELGEIESEMDSVVINFSNEMQEKINTSLEEMERQRQQRANRNNENVQPQQTLKTDVNEKGISKEEKKERVKNGEKELKKIIEACMNGDSGQGKFTKIVFQNYFKDANIIDKRSMFGSAIRGATPTAAPGKFLGDLLKGAGPLFQKLMQGLPADGFDQDMRTALEDMKSKLAPIPERIVKAQLLGMVERSNGRISKIEVTRALGAASVGQTFLCKMYGKDLPAEGKDVVVKLLKPDVRNRMMREKNVMLRCAEATDTSGGMKATYLGQLSRIEEELDLTIEARNVVKGAIYDKTYNGTESDGVKSMKLNNLVDPTVNSMVLEKAPGETVDKYIKELDFTAQAIDELLKRKEDEVQPKPVKRPINDGKLTKEEYEKKLKEYNDYTKTRIERNKKYRNRIMQHFEQYNRDITSALKRQKYMTSLADKWVSEGIFGEGFYHGDLHAGNIMIDDEGLTVIDFGNATTLDEHQQVQVTRMVAAAAVGDISGFKEGLKKLLKPEFEKEFKKNEKRLTLELKKIFSLGDKNSAGLRIAVALLKAQELGLEVPSSIFNFSQCQLRLQNAIDETNAQIETLKKNLYKFDKALMAGYDDGTSLFYSIIMNSGETHINGSDETGDEAIKRHFTAQRGLDKTMRLLKPELYTVEDSYIEKGNFSRIVFKELDPNNKGDFLPEMSLTDFEDVMMTIYLQMDAFKKIPGRSLTEKNFDEWDRMIENALNEASVLCDTESVKVHIMSYLRDAANKDTPHPDDADNEVAGYWKAKIQEKINRVKDLTDSCRQLESSVMKGEVKGEQAEDAKKQINEKYTEFLLIKAMHTIDSPIGKLTQGLANTTKREEYSDFINEAASYDYELGAKLLDDYNRFKTYQDNNPTELIEDSVEMKTVVEDIIKLTAIRIDPVFNDLDTIRKETPQSFVDVMGDTILRNLTVSLKRLGFFTSIQYNKALGAEG